MDSILICRGKRDRTDDWVEGYYVHEVYDGRYKGLLAYSRHWIYTGEIAYSRMADPMPIRYEVCPETVGRYTGLADKNGKKIFEGHKVRDEKGSIGYVTFLQQEAGFVIVYENGDMRLGHRNRGSAYDSDNGLEIIGTMFGGES